MPRLDLTLQSQAQLATGIVAAGETMRAAGGPLGRSEWSRVRIEALYELAYLRVFATWEWCLESIFFRSLCGFASRAGQETPVTGGFHRSVAAAEGAVFAAYGPHTTYLLWHNAGTVIRRCQRFIRSGPGCPAAQETTLSSNRARLDHWSAVRHRIVHEQADALRNFDAATLAMAGRTYPASRPGKMLRDLNRTAPAPFPSWLEVAVNELVSLVGQMV